MKTPIHDQKFSFALFCPKKCKTPFKSAKPLLAFSGKTNQKCKTHVKSAWKVHAMYMDWAKIFCFNSYIFSYLFIKSAKITIFFLNTWSVKTTNI